MLRKSLALLTLALCVVALTPTFTSAQTSTVYVNDTTKVIKADLKASNGVVHIIDGVLLPPVMRAAMMSGATMSAVMPATMNATTIATMSATTTATAVATLSVTMASTASAPSVADIIGAEPQLSTLYAALKAADLVDTLGQPGSYTVFAPTNDALAAALKATHLTAEQFLADKKNLTLVLTYHVVPQTLLAANLTNGLSVKTLQGDVIVITVK